ncbi:UNVERIFIED_CONTAM: hypothetical protein RMT77_004050 [Armadillidium vulgare]
MEINMEETAVLLGLAEVKAPFKNLTYEEMERIVHICYRKLLSIDNGEVNNALEKNLKCIGVVDFFYALQEVVISIREGSCCLYRKSEVILKNKLSNVLIALPALDYPSRLIVVSQTQNFGRTLLVLQLTSKEIVQLLVTNLESEINKKFRRNSTNQKSTGAFRKGADSFGKSMGKRVNDLFSSFGTINQIPEENESKNQTPDWYSASDSDDDDDSSDMDRDDSSDTSTQVKSVSVSSLCEARSVFHKNSIGPLEAEIQYLIQSETAFMESLKRLVEYKRTLLKNSNVIKIKHTHKMMKYTEELLSIHKDLLKKIKASNMNIIKLTNTFKEFSEKFRYHVHYISNIPAADRIYNIYNDVFKQTNPNLGEDLRKPRMRLNHYILTFESLMKASDENERESIQKIINMFKEYLKEADTRLVTDSVRFCPFSLTDYGHLTMNGELSLKKGNGLQRRRYQVLLLERMLVLARGTSTSSEYVKGFLLKDITLVHELRGVLIHLEVKITQHNSGLLIFKAASVKLQQKWIENLKNRITIIQKEAEEKQLRALEENLRNLEVKKKEKLPQEKRKREMPPLTAEMAFEPQFFNTKSEDINRENFVNPEDLQKSEGLLIKSMENILSHNAIDNDNIITDVKQLYEFHLRYFHPALTYEKSEFDFQISFGIVKHKPTFIALNEVMLFHAAVVKYEVGEGSSLFSLFNIYVDNFFKYKTYLLKVTERDVGIGSKTMQVIFERIIKNLNNLLKQRYIENFSSFALNSVIIEGFLSVKELLEDIENSMYVILTYLNTYLLSYNKACYTISTVFNNDLAKLGSTAGINSFQIKFSRPGQQKRKFCFTFQDVDAKSKWLKNFGKVLPQENQHWRRVAYRKSICEADLLYPYDFSDKSRSRSLSPAPSSEPRYNKPIYQSYFESNL